MSARFYTPRMATNPSFPEEVSWQRLVDSLSGLENNGLLEQATASLRRLQKFAFAKLKAALEDAEFEETSWEQPSLLIRVFLPPEFSPAASPANAAPSGARLDSPLPGGALTILTAGAARIVQDDKLYPCLPLPLANSIAALQDSTRKDFFAEWLQPASYGDEDAESGTVVGRHSDGETFQAGLAFRIHPLVLDPNAQEAYYDLEVGLPWEGNTDPESWSQGEREALWATIFQCLVDA